MAKNIKLYLMLAMYRNVLLVALNYINTNTEPKNTLSWLSFFNMSAKLNCHIAWVCFPCYYAVLLHAERLSGLVARQGFVKEINPDVLALYFQFGYIPEPYSIYKNTYKLPAGHKLK